MVISIDAQVGADDDLGDSNHLEKELAIYDEDDTPDSFIRISEIIETMPKKWQCVYQLVIIEERSKAEARRIIGISDVRVGQLVKKIKSSVAEDEELKKCLR